MRRLPQAEVETKAEQEDFVLLGEKGSAGGAGRELALDTGEDPLAQGAASVLPTREVAAHWGSHSPWRTPSALPSLGGDDALSPQLLPDVEMISFTVEFGIGQHLTDARVSASAGAPSWAYCYPLPRSSKSE